MTLSILDAMGDAKLLGVGPFADLAPWKPWLTFCAAAYGLELDAEGEALFCKATDRSTYAPPPGGWREVVAIVGRQAGKTRLASALVAFEAALAPPCLDGELYALLLAQDHKAAVRTAFAYIAALFEASPLLRPMVVTKTSDMLELSNGMRVAAYPCRPAAIRGLRARVLTLDELAFFRSSEMLPIDVEALRAVRPTLATTGGRLIVLSSPYGQSGALWQLHRDHFGRDDSLTLVWQADAPTMNPTLPADYLARMQGDDPEAYRSEVLGEFRAGLSTLLDPDALEACVADRLELAPAKGLAYSAFVDVSAGRRDAFTVAIGRRDGERAIVDLVRAWPAPFNPSGVVAECAELLATYRVSRVRGDRFAGEWPREAFRAHGISYDVAELDRSALYLALLPKVQSASIELPDDRELLRELRGLERRRGSSGRDRVDHPPGAHDDRANAVAGLVAMLQSARARGDCGITIGSVSDFSLPLPMTERGFEARAREEEREADRALLAADAARRRAMDRSAWWYEGSETRVLRELGHAMQDNAEEEATE